MNLAVPAPHAVIEAVGEDGACLRVRRHGVASGPRLLISHGNGFGIDGYFPFWTRFLAAFDVAVFDMRSHGQNPQADPANHNYAHMTRDLDAICRAVRDEFGRKPTAGLFHSMSAQCAMLQALAGNSEFAALVLFDPPNVPRPGHAVRVKWPNTNTSWRIGRGIVGTISTIRWRWRMNTPAPARGSAGRRVSPS